MDPSWIQVGLNLDQVGANADPQWTQVGPNLDPINFYLGTSGLSWTQIGPKLDTHWTALDPRWTQLDPSWTYVDSSLSQVGPTLDRVGPSWTQVGPSWTQVGPIWIQLDSHWTQLDPTRTQSMWAPSVPQVRGNQVEPGGPPSATVMSHHIVLVLIRWRCGSVPSRLTASSRPLFLSAMGPRPAARGWPPAARSEIR